MERIQVTIAEADPLMREILGHFLARLPDVQLVDDSGHGTATARTHPRRDLAKVVLAATPPGLPGYAMIRELKALYPEAKLLVLAGHHQLDHVIRALASGAEGILTRGDVLGELAGAIRHLARGGRYICPDVAYEFAMRGIHAETGCLPPRAAVTAKA